MKKMYHEQLCDRLNCNDCCRTRAFVCKIRGACIYCHCIVFRSIRRWFRYDLSVPRPEACSHIASIHSNSIDALNNAQRLVFAQRN